MVENIPIKKDGYRLLNGNKTSKLFVMQFLRVFLPWAIVLFALFSYFYLSETRKQNSIRLESELLNVGLGKRSINLELQSVFSDLLILAQHQAFSGDDPAPPEASLQTLENDFLVFSKMKVMYDQIRFLDSKGMEIVRVNNRKGDVLAVHGALLQNKGSRYYFKKSFDITRGKIYVSPLDLNMEHGEIEQPYKPMIRFGTPVFNSKGEKTGIVLLNYLANRLLDNFTHAAEHIQDHVMIINSDGYWLKHPLPEMEWGFMLNPAHNFIAAYPAAWEKFFRKESGQFANDSGLFTFTTVHPFQSKLKDAFNRDTGESRLTDNRHHWKVISYVSQDVIATGNNVLLVILLKIASPIFLFLMLLSWRLAVARIKNRKAEQELHRAATVFEAASEGIVITDADNKIQTVNSSFTEITGYSMAEVIGKSPSVLKSGRQDGEFYREMWEQLLASHRWQGEVLNRRKDGTIYPQSLSVVALVDSRNTIQNFVALFSDITIKKKNEELLKQQATIDALTGLPNRQLFHDRLSRALLHSKRLESRFALFFIDLDKFKNVNDTLGHTAGDLLLKQVSQRIQNVTRVSDTVARIGGDEFTIILNNISKNEDAARVAQIIIEAVSEPYVLNGQVATIGASIGIALYPKDGSEQTILINNADSAMYKAKEDGRNRYCFFDVIKQKL